MMNRTQSSVDEQYPRRLHELEQRFGGLFAELNDSPQKEAISILHGMMQELWRQLRRTSSPLTERGLTIDDIANLYHHAPKMEGPARTTPLPPGTKAPDFALPDASGQLVRLEDLRGQSLVVVFYPLDWSPGCSQQLDLYQHELDEFARRGAQVVGISVDSVYSHGAWAAVRGLGFPLLADFNPKGGVARKYRVYREDLGFTDRALYLIDGDGVIRYSHVSPFLHHIPDTYELFAALDAVKSTAAVPAGARS
jgi:peroxiredoxin